MNSLVYEYRGGKDYEYSVVLMGLNGFNAFALEKRLNEYGRHGWELVQMDGGYGVFKRLKRLG